MILIIYKLMYIVEPVEEKRNIGPQLDFDYSCLIPA